MKRFSLADAESYTDKGVALWPDEHREVIAEIAWSKIRYRQDHQPAMSYEELHPVCKEMLQPFLGKLPDLHLTGSWLGGWWSHPEHGAEDRQEIRKMLKKPPVSDLDFWTPSTPKDKAMDTLKYLGRKYDIPVSWVEWWGPAMDLTTGEWKACNPAGIYKAEWSYLNK